ncbi:Beta-barrel assembly machine subunit BamD [Devosia enhydra]|uniref:Outer membrane protein assembly factor BamD n=1 Tax=Devosia enhydra TaxID=665118 RepID=A0A1K2HW04_9HYPH|nr:Beta-barrel assembly machine subunit BamD [Devosia enhydra]
MARNSTGQFVILKAIAQHTGRAGRILAIIGLAAALSACNLFGPTKIKEEAIVPPETLYQSALADMDGQRFNGAITTLQKLERQHPYSEFKEKAQLMTVYANFRIGKYEEAVLAADRYMALYPASPETPYILWLKGSSYYGQIKDITRDQQLSRNAIETFQLVVSNYPKSEYAKDAKDKMLVATDQMAGKEMSVGRYYLGNGQYTAAINRFRVVVEQYQTSTHIEEALYRLTEANLLLGLVGEAQTAAAVLGHNYPSSSWYKQAFALLEKQGLSPNLNSGSPLASAVRRG